MKNLLRGTSLLVILTLCPMILLTNGCENAELPGENDSQVATVTGTISLPVSVTNRPYAVLIDSDPNWSNGSVAEYSGNLTGNSISYSFSSIPEGSYYVYALVSMSEETDIGGPLVGDYAGLYGITNITDTVSPTPNCTVDADGLNVFDFQLLLNPGAIVSGTITLPESVTEKPYFVIVDEDTNAENGYVGIAEGTITGSSINYGVAAIEIGEYFIYAVVYNSGDSASAPAAGDYFGAWSADSIEDWPDSAEAAAITANNGITFDFDFELFTITADSGNGDGDGDATLTVSLPTNDDSILEISSGTPLIFELYTEPTQAKAREAVLTAVFTDKAQVKTFSLTPDTYYFATAYYDSDNNGVDPGDIVGDLLAFSLAAGESVSEVYYPLSSNMRSGKALVTIDDLAYILDIEFDYTGSVAVSEDDTGAWMNFIVTADGDHPYDTSAWVYAPNGGDAQNRRLNIGLDTTKDYSFFIYLDVDRSESITDGDRVSSVHAVVLADLSTYDGSSVANSFTFSDEDMTTY